jgi:predicted ester cyclase
VRFYGMTIAEVENGRIVRGWNVFDQLGMFQQLGMVNLP